MCIYALTQTIDYYKRNSSPVFICYLDASKAFDRVNHWCIFKKNHYSRHPYHHNQTIILCDGMVLNCTVFDGAISYLMVLQVRMVLRKEEFFLSGFLFFNSIQFNSIQLLYSRLNSIICIQVVHNNLRSIYVD